MVSITAHPVRAQSLFEQVADDYNAVILGNFSGSGGDTEGRHLTTGNFSVTGTGYTVGGAVIGPNNPAASGRDDLVVGGNLTGNIAVVTEDAVIGGTLSGSVGLVSSPVSFPPYNSSGTGTLTVNAGPFDIDLNGGNITAVGLGVSLSQLAIGLKNDSIGFFSLPDSPGITTTDDGFGSISITFPSAPGTYVYNASEAFWDGNKFRTINASVGSTVLINVGGSAIDLSGTTTLIGISRHNVLANYAEATSFTLTSMDHEGSILAPFTNTVSQSGGGINGVAVFGGDVSKTNGGEYHNFLFQGTLPTAIPEPAAAALLLPGLVLMAMRRRA